MSTLQTLAKRKDCRLCGKNSREPRREKVANYFFSDWIIKAPQAWKKLEKIDQADGLDWRQALKLYSRDEFVILSL